MGIAAFFAAALGLVWSQLRLSQFSLDSPLPSPIWSSPWVQCGPATKSLLFILTLPFLRLFNVTKCASRQSHPRNHWPFILTAEPHLFWPVTPQITCQLTTRLLDYGTGGPNAGTDTLGRWRYIWRLSVPTPQHPHPRLQSHETLMLWASSISLNSRRNQGSSLYVEQTGERYKMRIFSNEALLESRQVLPCCFMLFSDRELVYFAGYLSISNSSHYIINWPCYQHVPKGYVNVFQTWMNLNRQSHFVCLCMTLEKWPLIWKEWTDWHMQPSKKKTTKLSSWAAQLDCLRQGFVLLP